MAKPKSKPKHPVNRDVRRTIPEVAKFFGMSTAAVMAWRAEAEPMPGSSGNYNLSKIAQWRLTKSSTGRGLNEDQKKADIRLKTITAQQKELEYEKEKGQLLDLAAVELWASVAMIETREMVMALPEMLATSSPPELREFVRSETDRHVRDVLTMLRRKLETDLIETGDDDATPG